ncbi:hypothetical protein BCR42DRAFT_478055 [Absidia repens]|uniref:Mediator of RNA polymerase II transcription subunit 1 n=1 Tax=Absidia repens TaxID=90262 RepID=A0A1X2IMA5_9FUNG|nr:hypothetical protein BCR42DRAFT_478055 [Absidia repens]
MSKNVDSKNSVSSSVFGIKRLLQLHAFGPVNIDKARTEFKQHIDVIRSICSQFETEVLGDVMKQGSGAESSFGKHFNQLKEQATTESTVIRLQEYLQQSSTLLETALNDKEASKSTVKVQQLENLAKSMGLVSFVDSSQKESGVPSTTITLGGKVIVIDIDIDNDGLVQRAKVTFVSESLQRDHDENLDILLAEDLQTHNFDTFRRNLGTLALLDQLNVEYTPTDFFTLVRNLYKDLRATCNQETLLLSNNILDVLLDGHGIPSLYLDYPGISIAYWINKTKAKTIDWDDVRDTVEQKKIHPSLRQAAKLLISFEESKTSQYFLPPYRSNYMLTFDECEDSINETGNELKIITETKCPRFMQPLRFVKPISSNTSNAIPVRFVAKLDEPIAASDIIVHKLAEATGVVKGKKCIYHIDSSVVP